MLLFFSLIIWKYFAIHGISSEIIQLLRQPVAQQDSTYLGELIEQRTAVHRFLIISMSVFAFLICLVAIAVSQSIIGPLRRTIEYAEGIAQGRLGERASYWASGEVANVRDAVSDMQEQLTEVVLQVADATQKVDVSADCIEQSSIALHHHFEEQGGSLERVTGRMRSVASSMQQKVEQSVRIDELVRDTHVSIENGGDIVKNTVAAMEEIHDSSTEIKEIICIIDEIAFQTNLLALNAAVEAARSGEHGRGFAVVASEVRNLAQRSTESASQIKTLIEDSVAKVQEGSRLASASGDTLAEITSRFGQVVECISDMTKMTEIDVMEVAAIITDVKDVEKVMPTGQALIESVSVNSKGLKQASSRLANIIDYFKVKSAAKQRAADDTLPMQTALEPTSAGRDAPKPRLARRSAA